MEIKGEKFTEEEMEPEEIVFEEMDPSERKCVGNRTLSKRHKINVNMPRALKDTLRTYATEHGFRGVQGFIQHMFKNYVLMQNIKKTADYRDIVKYLNDEEKNKVVENVSDVKDKIDGIDENIQIIGSNLAYFNKKLLEMQEQINTLIASKKGEKG
jgi:hypothetical protein